MSGHAGKDLVYELLRGNDRLMNAHAKFMKAGGEELLHALSDSMGKELWPWDAEPHVQASYGAFTSGVSWTSYVLRNLVTLSRNRSELEATLSVGDSGREDQIRQYLTQSAGYRPEEVDNIP